MRVVEDLSEEERFLLAILQDRSGVDQAEFFWEDRTHDSGVFRCHDYQYFWYRAYEKHQVDQTARSTGKTLGVTLRAFAFPLLWPGEHMLLTAPELIHLNPLTRAVEERITETRITNEMLDTSRGKSGVSQRPFQINFKTGSKIMGRIPQRDGKGVKGQHVVAIELDEAQDYPSPGWIEIEPTLKSEVKGSYWHAHGVTRGVRDDFYRITQPQAGWRVHNLTSCHTPGWSDEERARKIDLYGSRHAPDYLRNVMGQHGDASAALFVLARLMQIVDSNEDSDYNTKIYHKVRITDELIQERHLPIDELLRLPGNHTKYEEVWIGVDLGVVNNPTEVLVFAHENTRSGPGERMTLITRIRMERVTIPTQREAFAVLNSFYRPRAFAIDSTGIGLPVLQEITEGSDRLLASRIRGFNFSEKVALGYEENEKGELEEVKGNVLEASTDFLRELVDEEILRLPWDVELLREFQGQTVSFSKSPSDPYGRRRTFSKGNDHTLDAARCAVLAWRLNQVMKASELIHEPVYASFVGA